MRLVIELARTNFQRDTGGPFAAAVFDDASARLVALGVNRRRLQRALPPCRPMPR